MPLTARTVVPSLIVALFVGVSAGVLSSPLADSAGGGGTATESPSPEAAGPGLTAAADQQSVPVNGRLTITGRLTPAQGGVTLVVQRLENGTWRDFPATTTTSADGSYSVWLQSGRTGENSFRMMRPDDGTTSNEVRVSVT